MRKFFENIALSIAGIIAPILMCLLMALCRIAGVSLEE